MQLDTKLDKTVFFSSNLHFIIEIYQKYLENPASIDVSWADFFNENSDDIEKLLGDKDGASWSKKDISVLNFDYDISSMAKPQEKKSKKSNKSADIEIKIHHLITAYKNFGHLAADLDPLKLSQKELPIEIDPKFHNISPEDLNKEIDLKGKLGLKKAKITDIINKLNQIYSSKIASEFEYIRNFEQKQFLEEKIEALTNQKLSIVDQKRILKDIIRTENFEQFLHKRFPGAKRFSVEGGDSSINAVEEIIENSAKNQVKKIIIGMAHRGRLNVLTGVMGKPYSEMIAEFKGKPGIPKSITKSGDVKYHMGYANSREIAGNKIDLSLAFNPSHLEAVNPVVCGRVRAKQDIYGDKDRKSALAILIHGDAAFAGQGSVAENLMMNGLDGYNTGGVIHIITNNQIGFTANPDDSRSTQYASDLAKAIDAPIFHINGDDVESVAKISKLAVEFRQKFQKDIILDIICYRRYGHNEGDEPLYTQPIMYKIIKNHPTLKKIYSEKLIASGAISSEEYKKLNDEFNSHLEESFSLSEKYEAKKGDWLEKDWNQIKDGDKNIPETGIESKKLKDIFAKISQIPENFTINPKIAKQFEQKITTFNSKKNINWGIAESLAFASLIEEGSNVRITGQDAGRGTFSHRHSILTDYETGNRINTLNNIKGANYEVYDSILSEYAVLGFEYGYSLSSPNNLTIWEAQFGDFANGAQVIFDQFIASSEVKWLRKSGLVCLLPHGYEGQGPEHSSARLERFLQLAADDNMRICNITNPANFFHALRRQIHSKDRKPLIIMSPKSLLRHKLAVSKLEEFAPKTKFQPILTENSDVKKVKKAILCSGKIYYDLVEAREAKKLDNITIIRLEEIYPFPSDLIKTELKKYKLEEIIWCQEEPKNMGSWFFVRDYIDEILEESKINLRLKYAGRVASASPATGYASYHKEEQEKLINDALEISSYS
jgi:2-oxoglutarate dehydrogenase E1 component